MSDKCDDIENWSEQKNFFTNPASDFETSIGTVLSCVEDGTDDDAANGITAAAAGGKTRVSFLNLKLAKASLSATSSGIFLQLRKSSLAGNKDVSKV